MEVAKMIKFSKIAISLPKEDLDRIEKVRKALKIQRSAAIDMAIRYWLDSFEKKRLVDQYEAGYKNKPEVVEEIKALEKISAEAFEEEGWK
jgi:metal-responsive CopG/Arc/MetJ family transcriptional regulator